MWPVKMLKAKESWIILFFYFLFKPARQNGPKQYAAIIGSDEISPDVLQIAESVGSKLADIMLNSEAREILKEAKKQTAAAVIEEKERKDKERQEKEKQQQQQQQWFVIFVFIRFWV